MFRPIVVLPCSLLAMALLVAGAFGVDCVRLAEQAAGRVALADDSLAPLEARLVAMFAESDRLPEDLSQALRQYDSQSPRATRHAAFERIAGLLDQVALETPRRASADEQQAAQSRRDDAAGLVNRWRIARQAYDGELEAYRQYLASFRGQMAQNLGHAPR